MLGIGKTHVFMCGQDGKDFSEAGEKETSQEPPRLLAWKNKTRVNLTAFIFGPN